MKLSDIITDDLVSDLVVKYSETAAGRVSDWRAVETVAKIAATVTANALGVQLEVEKAE